MPGMEQEAAKAPRPLPEREKACRQLASEGTHAGRNPRGGATPTPTSLSHTIANKILALPTGLLDPSGRDFVFST